MTEFTAEQTKKIETLTGIGLPKEQAEKSAATDAEGSCQPTHQCSTYVCMKIKEGADMEALKTHFKTYATNSKNSKGKIYAQHMICNGEVQAIEVWNSPSAMDAHIGNCFPSYAQMLGHCDMTEINAICDESEVEWYKTSLSAWSATKFHVGTNI